MKKLILYFLFLAIACQGIAQNNGRFSGKVIDKTTQKPISNVSVSLKNGNKGVLTDANGLFRMTEIAYNSYHIDFTIIGYQPKTIFNIIIGAGNETNLTIELEPSINQLKEVVVKNNRRSVKAASLETPLSVQRLTAEEIKANPGSNFDISKVIQILPGVGGGQGGGGFRNDIIIRGGGPNENVYYLDGIEIPVLNHFQTQGSSGGPQGMLNVSFIEDVKLSSSAFDAKYDNALSSVFQFKQKNGNANKFQGNLRLSATELAATLEGPLSKDKKTTFLVSARRSYLQLLFSALDLPIRPNYWDFQTKITKQINPTTTLSFIGLAAIDEFSFAPVKNSTPEKLYNINANPSINQWNYTGGISLKKLLPNGFLNIALSRNAFDNHILQYEDNEIKDPTKINLNLSARETENKFRIDVNKNFNDWKLAYGASLQYVSYDNQTFTTIRKELKDNAGNVIQSPVIVNFKSPLNGFWKYGFFAQVGKRLFNNRLGLSAGIRTDMNSFTNDGNQPFETLSPRASLNYRLSNEWSINASIGKYFKVPPYTILGFANNSGSLVNKNAKYQESKHHVIGVEYLPNDGLRITAEAFYKQYNQVPVSVKDGISLANLGGDFNVLGNEAVQTDGKGETYGFEFFAQKKLTDRFFGIFSYTYYNSKYSGSNGILIPSSWDNRHLLTISWGYKFKRNWELGVKFRMQGGAPYTPYEESLSRTNYLSLGKGIFDYHQLNTLRLRGFNSSDLRIDKKWNFKKTTIDLFLDITNWYKAKANQVPYYTFKRTDDNKSFVTNNGLSLKPDGSNAIPLILSNDDAIFAPTLGFIVEF